MHRGFYVHAAATGGKVVDGTEAKGSMSGRGAGSELQRETLPLKNSDVGLERSLVSKP